MDYKRFYTRLKASKGYELWHCLISGKYIVVTKFSKGCKFFDDIDEAKEYFARVTA